MISIALRVMQSMSHRGNCWDNAVTENFFHTLEGHIIYGEKIAQKIT
jgi:transposase InsO family protein